MAKVFGWNFRTGLLLGCAIAIAVAAAAITYDRYDSNTLKRTRNRDAVLCGVNPGRPGFSVADAKGDWSGFDVDFCRAMAATIFDDPRKVKFIPLDASERFSELRDRKVDVLSPNTTWNMERETNYGLHFAAVSYYDGQGFMVPRTRNADSSLELDDSKVCVLSDPTTQLHLANYFGANSIKYQEKKFASQDVMLRAYESRECDVLTADVSRLYAMRIKVAHPSEHVILPDVISREPLAPVVRQKDDDWLLIVKWTFYAMVNAEELGITSHNLDAALKSANPEVRRLVGIEGGYGEELGLPRDWAARIIRHVGNYAEIYDRNVGAESALGIPRGLNQLWNGGGILYAPPIR